MKSIPWLLSCISSVCWQYFLLVFMCYIVLIYGLARYIPVSSGDTQMMQITLKEFLVTFVNLYGISKWSANTYSSKLSSINNYINPLIGDWKLNEITTKKLSQYYNDLLSVPEVPRANRKATGRCVQPANIKKIHDIIRCALNQAIRWEYLDSKMRNPASLATLPKVPKVKRKVWNVQTLLLLCTWEGAKETRMSAFCCPDIPNG